MSDKALAISLRTPQEQIFYLTKERDKAIQERDEARALLDQALDAGEALLEAGRRGYRRGVQDAAKMLAEGPQKSGRPWPNPDKAILALLEKEKTGDL